MNGRNALHIMFRRMKYLKEEKREIHSQNEREERRSSGVKVLSTIKSATHRIVRRCKMYHLLASLRTRILCVQYINILMFESFNKLSRPHLSTLEIACGDSWIRICPNDIYVNNYAKRNERREKTLTIDNGCSDCTIDKGTFCGQGTPTLSSAIRK